MKLLCVDGNSIFNRAFYGIKLLTTKDGTFTNAIYGFMNILMKMEQDIEPDAVAIAFDLPGKTFRHKQYEEYKANRTGMPKEMRPQMPLLKELLTDLGYNIVEKEGYEADDILGTFSRTLSDNKDYCIIATGDRDSLQLINPYTTVRLATTKGGTASAQPIGVEEFKEIYGIEPSQHIDVKAIMGDSSDNIPGVKGIGEKGALKLIQAFGSLDGVYEHLDDSSVIKPAMKTKLETDKERAYMSKDLATIYLEVPIDTDPEHYKKTEGNPAKASALLNRLEMFSVAERLGVNEASSDKAKETLPTQEIKVVKNPENITYTPNSNCFLLFQEDQITMSFSDMKHTLYVFERYSLAKPTIEKVSDNTKLFVLDSKSLYHRAFHYGFADFSVAFDLNLAAYLDNPSSSDYTLEKLILQYPASSQVNTEEEFFTLAKNHFDFVSISLSLKDIMEEKDFHQLYYDIELPLAKVLEDMEFRGIAIDKEGVVEFGDVLKKEIDKMTAEIYSLAGEEFNINSPKQLGVILFEKLELPVVKKTKTGYSTNAEVLEFLRDKHPIVEQILQYRTYTKLNSTYVEGLLKVIGEDGRIHSTFNQTETRTGRISSTEPNMQNIPVRTELGSQMRKFFVAKEGYTFVDADYSQIELRVLAHIADDKNMLAAFGHEEDIHRDTAAQVFNMPREMVTPLMRSRAKAVNFGIVYGIGAFSLSKDIGVTVKEADEYIKNYLNTYQGVKQFMEDTVEYGKEHGYVKTLFGRRRYLPELESSNRNIQAFGKRVAMNMPIQGTAADIIKIAMVKVYTRLEESDLDAKLILQVHDELIVECKENIAQEVAVLLKEEMENAVSLKVKLAVDANLGKDWYQAKG